MISKTKLLREICRYLWSYTQNQEPNIFFNTIEPSRFVVSPTNSWIFHGGNRTELLRPRKQKMAGK